MKAKQERQVANKSKGSSTTEGPSTAPPDVGMSTDAKKVQISEEKGDKCNQWELKAVEEAKDAKAEYERIMTKPPSEAPKDHQTYVTFVPFHIALLTVCLFPKLHRQSTGLHAIVYGMALYNVGRRSSTFTRWKANGFDGIGWFSTGTARDDLFKTGVKGLERADGSGNRSPDDCKAWALSPEELADREDAPIETGGPDDITCSHLSILGFKSPELSSTECTAQGLSQTKSSREDPTSNVKDKVAHAGNGGKNASQHGRLQQGRSALLAPAISSPPIHPIHCGQNPSPFPDQQQSQNPLTWVQIPLTLSLQPGRESPSPRTSPAPSTPSSLRVPAPSSRLSSAGDTIFAGHSSEHPISSSDAAQIAKQFDGNDVDIAGGASDSMVINNEGVIDMDVDDAVAVDATESSRKRRGQKGDQDTDLSVKPAKRRRGVVEETRVTRLRQKGPARPAPKKQRRSKLAMSEAEQMQGSTAEVESKAEQMQGRDAKEKGSGLNSNSSEATFPTVPAQAPDYIRLALELFVTVGGNNSRWKALVRAWIEMEKKARYQARSGSLGISKQDRPKAVGMWINRGRKRFDPKIDLDNHALKFSNWWRMMQPEEREEEKELDDDGESFNIRYSRNVSILVALAWWMEAVHNFNEKVKSKGIREQQAGRVHEEKLTEALEEVYHVFGV
ncbi:hypothetical protein BT96DRAFT_936230 [Gymnopus androsaceus JB14]|uniref:Uncharacterized protein n=1 Tax=Gymnopus androsaceus JB14 TaxID=1447944 RepID=A0A6A4I2D0_9AGAR|nr:hypothetical protein BT96DRAFT_936230 [Gymnopus androsaceus JB14]